jgi:hypothetical protein
VIFLKGGNSMVKTKKNKRIISLLSVILIILLYWLFRYPLNRQVNMEIAYDKNIQIAQGFDNKYFILLKIPMRGINVEKNVNSSDLSIQDFKPIKLECTKEQYDYLNNLTGKEQPPKIHFKNSYFNPSKFKLVSIE